MHQRLLDQAKLTYRLWVGCVFWGFIILLSGIIVMLCGFVEQGIAAAVSSIITFFIQRIFQQREDHYQAMANKETNSKFIV